MWVGVEGLVQLWSLTCDWLYRAGVGGLVQLLSLLRDLLYLWAGVEGAVQLGSLISDWLYLWAKGVVVGLGLGSLKLTAHTNHHFMLS